MNIFYLFSGLGSRIFNLLMFVALSYLMSVEDFGRFSLVVGNAMLLQLLITGWISSALWRDASQVSGQGPDKQDYAAMDLPAAQALRLAALIALFYCATAIMGFFLIPAQQQYLAIIPLISIFLLFNEIILVALNARHLDRSYGLLSFARGFLCLITATALVVAGYGLWGAIIAQIIGMAIALLLLPDARHFLRSALAVTGLGDRLGEKLRFGLISVLALNLYMLGNVLGRNLIAVQIDVAHAGYFSLAADLFYAPLALFATAFSLSSIPQLYRGASSGVDVSAQKTQRQDAGQFILANLAVALPYAMGGGFAAPIIAQLILAPENASGIMPIASYAVLLGTAFVIISALTTLMLTRGHILSALAVSIGAMLSMLLAMVLAPAILRDMAQTSSLVLACFAIVAVCYALFRGMIALPALASGKILLATAVMVLPLWLAGHYLHGWLALIAMILLGAGSYLVAGRLLNSAEILGLLRFHTAAKPGKEVA
jgi:O-antigen/teichoic acid export membrane protein